jgi:mercuric ion transport protein
MSIKAPNSTAPFARGQAWLAAGGLLGAVAATSCCILPLALFALGASGAWIANFTRLAPYQPYVIAGTIAFLAAGYWLVYRASQRACAEEQTCARPLPRHLIKAGLILATILVVAALGFDFVAPLVLNP